MSVYKEAYLDSASKGKEGEAEDADESPDEWSNTKDSQSENSRSNPMLGNHLRMSLSRWAVLS